METLEYALSLGVNPNALDDVGVAFAFSEPLLILRANITMTVLRHSWLGMGPKATLETSALYTKPILFPSPSFDHLQRSARKG
jgi:hypothetical protein